MKEVKVKLYHFDELSEDVKHKLCERERVKPYGITATQVEWDAEERIETLQLFCDMFGIKFEIDYDHQLRFINWHFKDVDMNGYDWSDEDICGKYLLRFLNRYYYDIRSRKYFYRLMKSRHSRIMWEEQCCPFTGMCFDCDILEKIFEWYKNPNWEISLHDLFEECFRHYLKLWADDEDYYYSDEFICERLEEDCEVMFLEDGTVFDGNYEDVA